MSIVIIGSGQAGYAVARELRRLDAGVPLVLLTRDGGEPHEYGPGEAFVIPRGFAGVWETLEPVRKIYAIAG